MIITAGPAGPAITIGLLTLIGAGQHLFGSVPAGQSIAVTSFAPCLIVAAAGCRSETGTALTTATFDSKQMNRAILGEFVLAVLVTQMDMFNRLPGTTQLTLRQFGWAPIPSLALLLLREPGKHVARRTDQELPAPRASVTCWMASASAGLTACPCSRCAAATLPARVRTKRR